MNLLTHAHELKHTYTHNGRPTGNTIVMTIRNMQISIELLDMEKFKKIEKNKILFLILSLWKESLTGK